MKCSNIQLLGTFLIFGILRCEAANILVINHYVLKSHIQFMGPIIDALAERHNVTLYTAMRHTSRNKINFTQIVFENDEHFAELQKAISQSVDLSFKGGGTYDEGDSIFTNAMYAKACTYTKAKPILDLYNSSMKYDVMILHAYFGECFLTLSYIKDIPVIKLAPSFPLYWHFTILGDPNIFQTGAYFHQDNLPTGKIMDTISNMIRVNIKTAQRNKLLQTSIQTFAEDHLPNVEIPPLSVLERRFSLILTNTVPAMGHARLKPPMIIDIGGIHCREAKKLPKEMDDFINAAGNHGFIYVSFGSSFPSALLPDIVEVFLMEAFRRIPQRVVLKWHQVPKDLPDNVMISNWLPQQDILGDSRIKAFISQCGILSMQEAVYHGVPVIGIPIGVDQFTNAALAEERGYGCRLNMKHLTVDGIMHCIERTVNDPSMKRNTLEISSVMRDTMVSPLDAAIWWTEFVIRHGGTYQLRPRGHDLPWYRQMETHVTITLIAVTFIFIILALFLLSCKCLMKRINVRLHKKGKPKVN